MNLSNLICITDVGSTTTKGVLLEPRDDGKYQVAALSQAPTTVESPWMDVRFGVYEAIKDLEKVAATPILLAGSSALNIKFVDNVYYLTTSSAGGGLQILVIGLTVHDSASSAKRASLGAGGVILDTFAIDDKRQTVEQMLEMRVLHPDMILLSGGVDHGAVTSVIRLAEIVRIANPQPKYNSEEKLPMIFAGNCEAADLISRMISKSFDLHILPNLRPTMVEENFIPTQNMIRNLFMENVMEHAPGYKSLKEIVSHDIIPTPMGVLNAMHGISETANKNIFLVDIGGATTDVFSYIKGTYQRSVSANLGMSYSALNVFAEAGLEAIMQWLPDTISERELRNYIINKTINPTVNPKLDAEYMLEHALAREAIRLAFAQHQQMHFEANKMGFLDKMKNNTRDKYDIQFNFTHADDVYKFRMSEINTLVGAGGIFSHCQNTNQALMVMIDAIMPKGITEICRDKDFITPHMGVLSELDSNIAHHILRTECIEPLAMHIAPIYQIGKKTMAIMQVLCTDGGANIHAEIMSNALYYYPASGKMRTYQFKTYKGVWLQEELTEYKLETMLPVIIDTREHYHDHVIQINASMGLYQDIHELGQVKLRESRPESSNTHYRKIELPYLGETPVSENNVVRQDDVVALNRFAPPRLYVVNTTASLHDFDQAFVKDCITVGVGDMVEFDQILLDARHTNDPQLKKYVFYSPVRGKVESIDVMVGVIIISELQDYASKPVVVNISELLGIKPKLIGRYLKKAVGDFVFRNDLLAQRIAIVDDEQIMRFVHAPNTGNIIAIDYEKGTITIHFDEKPYNYLAHVDGVVAACDYGKSLSIKYQASRLKGVLGIGEQTHGELVMLNSALQIKETDLKGKVLACTFQTSSLDLRVLLSSGIVALIVPAMEQSDLMQLLGYELGVINTGNEKLSFSVIVLHGFGDIQILPQIQAFLTAAAGKKVFVDPHTRIRAGVVRPSIYIQEK